MCEATSHETDNDVQEHNPAIIIWVGTMHRRNLTFYKMYGKYFVRSKSSLTGKRVKRDACFKKTREFAAKLGRSSSIASAVYKQLPEGWKLHSLYRKLTGIGFQLLKTADYTDAEVITHLWKHLHELGYRAEIDYEEVPASTVKCEKPGQKKQSTLRKKQLQRITLKRKYWQHSGERFIIKDFPIKRTQFYLVLYQDLRKMPFVLSG